jgi:RIO kinase 1
LDALREAGWIDEVVRRVKSGKEATVYCCSTRATIGAELVAVKVYRDREDRTFKRDAVYREGTVILDRRLRRAVAKKSAAGRRLQYGSWIEGEFSTLCLLHAAGSDVPRPILYGAGERMLLYTGGATPLSEAAIGLPAQAMLMEYVGDEVAAAPHLQHAPVEREEAGPLFERLLRNVETWLAHSRVHGDLSPFNVLYWEGRLKVIDFPQAVDPFVNPNARALLVRDLENVCRYFARHGVRSDAARIADRLWRQYAWAAW